MRFAPREAITEIYGCQKSDMNTEWPRNDIKQLTV